MHRADDEHVRKAGGWNKSSAMEIHYISSASPEAACITAGFKGLDDLNPPHKHAEPSDELIKTVFGKVLTVRDPVTGADEGLDVDDAILICRKRHNDSKGKGVSAAPLFEVLRLLAKALLQVLILSPHCP